MKPEIKQIACLLLAVILILHTGCRKYKYPYNMGTGANHSQLPDTNILLPSSPMPTTQVYFGEFTFDNLSWEKDSKDAKKKFRFVTVIFPSKFDFQKRK